MKVRVTRADAEVVLRQVKRRFAYCRPFGTYGPQIKRNWDFFGHGPVPYAIVWEDGPYEWAYLVAHGGVDEEITTLAMTPNEYWAYVRTGRMDHPSRVERVAPPSGVMLEPYTSWAIGLWPA